MTIDYISDIFLDQTQNKFGHLYLIFTEPIGVEVFSFLKSDDVAIDSIE
jgi:hypothetical protein